MSDVQVRVVRKDDDERVALYFFSEDKLDGGASRRYALLSYEPDGWVLTLATRDPETTTHEVISADKIAEALARGFAYVQPSTSDDEPPTRDDLPKLKERSEGDPVQFDCDACGLEGSGTVLRGAWWSYPPGWFLLEPDRALVCSAKCAVVWEAAHPEPAGVEKKESGGALLAGLMAGAVMGAALRESMSVVNKIGKTPCARCGRVLLEHTEAAKDQCPEGYSLPKETR